MVDIQIQIDNDTKNTACFQTPINKSNVQSPELGKQGAFNQLQPTKAFSIGDKIEKVEKSHSSNHSKKSDSKAKVSELTTVQINRMLESFQKDKEQKTRLI